MTRTPQVAVAVLALVGIPGVVGAVTTPAAPAPEPSKTSLVAKVSGDERHGSNRARLRVMTDGVAPAKDTVASLLDVGGVHPAEVRALKDVAECKALKRRYATSTPGAKEWCLELSGIPDGRKVSGDVQGSTTTLTLTVSRPAPFFWLPLLSIFLGLVIGALIIVLPRWLRDKVRRGLLDKLVSENENAPADQRITELRNWVADRRKENISDDALLMVVQSVIEFGLPGARRARADLAVRLAETTLDTTHPYVNAAAEKSAPENHVSDFLKDDGTAVTPHPLREWISGLDALESEKAALEKAQVQIDGIPDPAKRVDPQAALTDARAALGAASSPSDAERVSEARKKVEIAIQKARQATPQVDFLVAGPGRDARAVVAVAKDEIAGLGRRLFSSGSLGGLKVITYALAGLIAAWAILALHQTLYAPNPAFGTDTDYLGLITAAIGSGAVGSILGLMAIWDPSRPAEE